MTKDELFDQFDHYFTADNTESAPEPIRLIFAWLAIPRLNRPHSDAVDIFIKRSIDAMSEATQKSTTNTHTSRLIDSYVDYYNLRSDIDRQLDKNCRILFDKLSDAIAPGGSGK